MYIITTPINSHNFEPRVSSPRAICLCSLQNALGKFESRRGWARFSRLNLEKLAVDSDHRRNARL